MRRAPSLKTLPRYPVTGGVMLCAVVATLVYQTGRDISPLMMDFRGLTSQPWRLVTSALPHGGVVHLFFNLYWLWIFGTILEESRGPVKLLGAIILLAAGSMAAEWAVLNGGIGLSGVGYGLFGLLWALGRNPRYAGMVDTNTVTLFVGWFFVCIVTTYTGAMRIANVAHGMGAVLGYLLGLAIVGVAGGKGKTTFRLIFILLLAVIYLSATWFRPQVNFSSLRGTDAAELAYESLKAGNNSAGIRYGLEAVRMNPQSVEFWWNLGLAYHRLGDTRNAFDAFGRAVDLQPGDKERAKLVRFLRATTRQVE